MAEIDFERELCWNIEPDYPIEVEIRKSANKVRIFVAQGLMPYEVWQDLGDNLKMSEEYWQTWLRSYQATLGDKPYRFQNDVAGSYYDYKDGRCEFHCSSMQDARNWLQLYDGIITEKP